MKFIFGSLLGLTLSLSAQNYLPTAIVTPEVTVGGAPQALYFVDASPGSRTLNLSSAFTMQKVDSQVVRFVTAHTDPSTNAPYTFDVALFSDATPGHRANFLNYVTSGRYDNSIIHRSVANFVIQGGGFSWNEDGTSLSGLILDPTVQNEFSISNTLGTVSLAKRGGNPNSGTSQWFVSLRDNVSTLDGQNGGFTVFGRVTRSTFPAAQSLNNFSQFPVSDVSDLSPSSELLQAAQTVASALGAMPFFQTVFEANSSPTAMEGFDASVRFTSVTLEPLPAGEAPTDQTLTYEVIANSNPSLISTSLNGDLLTFTSTAASGSSNIRIRATDSIGNSVEKTIEVQATTRIGYNTWRNLNFTAEEAADDSITGLEADANDDGVPNLFHYLFALPVNSPQASPLSFSFEAENAAQRVTLNVPFSDSVRNATLNFQSNLSLSEDGWRDLNFGTSSVEPNTAGPGRTSLNIIPTETFTDDRVFFRTIWSVSNR